MDALVKDWNVWLIVIVTLTAVTSGGEDLKFQPSHVDKLGDMYLTPWWDITLGTGETLEVDCGVYTGGDPLKVNIYWKNKEGQVISTDDVNR